MRSYIVLFSLLATLSGIPLAFSSPSHPHRQPAAPIGAGLVKRDCPAGPPACNADGCVGVNEPGGDQGNGGRCTGDALSWCPCTSICLDSAATACNDNECNGINTPYNEGGAGALGFCTAGDFNGCNCVSVCPETNVSCADECCAGFGAIGHGGYCTAGEYTGCACDN
jgi:hypothetical protein